jgi:sugar phosphate isomerase/epimerase
MMPVTRRTLLGMVAAGALSAARSTKGLRIGVTDWNLRQTGKVEALALAKRLGFEGVEVSLGRDIVGNKLPLDDGQLQKEYLAAAREHGIAVAGTCLDVLHVNYLKNDKLGQKWVAEGIPITRTLNGRVMLLPFFGKGALTTHAEMDYVGDALREVAPQAEKAGVILGLENTISARDNVRIMERTRSWAVKTYYDVGNSTSNGFDILSEIRWLGKDRICQFHLKDNPHYMGQGKIDFPAVVQAIAELGFEGFANLETSSPSKSIEDDMAKNLAYIRGLLKRV